MSVHVRIHRRVHVIDCPAPPGTDVLFPPAVCEAFAALKGKCDVKNMRQGWMGELKPAVNTNVLPSVYVCLPPPLSLFLPSSFSLFSPTFLSLATPEGARGSQSSSVPKKHVLSLLQKQKGVFDQVQPET